MNFDRVTRKYVSSRVYKVDRFDEFSHSKLPCRVVIRPTRSTLISPPLELDVTSMDKFESNGWLFDQIFEIPRGLTRSFLDKCDTNMIDPIEIARDGERLWLLCIYIWKKEKRGGAKSDT